jgi:Na+/H+ antiporter NhaD/arsenite permease-like protein
VLWGCRSRALRQRAAPGLAALALAALALVWAPPAGASEGAAGAGLGSTLPLWTVLPFALLLLSIAVLPLAAEHWWESNRNKGIVSAVLAVPFAAYLVATFGAEAAHPLRHSMLDYVSFIALLGSLFVISGGIHVRGSLAGTPLANSALLGLGAVLANLIGTTGASMVLIRPLLRANEHRRRRAHIVVFFIFVVANCGGLLTPLGDPPLFLGFLKGVPFVWTLGLWRQWLLVNGLLLAVFNVWDQVVLSREEKEVPEEALLQEVLEHQPFAIEGWHNFLLLGGVVLVILGKGGGWGNGGADWPYGVQEALMLALAVASYLTTKRPVHRANHFTFGPIIEVAVLFAGIFATMTAPLLILNARGASLGLVQPWHFYWATGTLSSFLDNAPTYLSFAAAAAGQVGVSVIDPHYLAEVLAKAGGRELLTAISCGAVMMGANTYIGNGPNFMVKAIAEHRGVKMPSFFAYTLYSISILLPIFVVVTLVFFR